MNEVTTINRTQREYSDAVKKALARKPQLYINGEWVDSSGDATIDVEDPSSGKVISSFVEATDKDIDRAVAAARTAFDDGRWRDLPPVVREKTMHAIADLIDAHADELAELEAIDVGKPKGMAGVVDVPGAAAHFRYMAGWAGKIGGETQAPYSMPGGMSRQRRSSNAVRAAATARSTSLSVASTNLEMILPEDGSSTSIVAPPELSTHSPLM